MASNSREEHALGPLAGTENRQTPVISGGADGWLPAGERVELFDANDPLADGSAESATESDRTEAFRSQRPT